MGCVRYASRHTDPDGLQAATRDTFPAALGREPRRIANRRCHHLEEYSWTHHYGLPEEFADPDIPIIILTGHGDRWRVLEAARMGANEFLVKPVSTRALQDRIIAIISRPRPSVKFDGYYGPMPRRIATI